jgi:hypothetical protein
MQTTTVPNPKNTFKQTAESKESPFDEVNSLLAITIYHQQAVGHTGSKSIKYYLKKKKDVEHQSAGGEDEQMAIELRRSVRFIENKVNGRYGDNRIVSIQVYFNDNKGGTVPETTPNPLLCKLNVLRNGNFEQVPNLEIIPTAEGQQFVGEIMMGWQQAIEKTKR